MTSVTANGITIEYDERGEGEPLLMLMGLATQLIAWPLDLVDMIAERGFRVVRMDNRDVGLSSKTKGPEPTKVDVAKGLVSRRLADADYLISDMAADALGLLDHLGIERAHVVGASMGGMIAQQLTIDHPERVASLTSMMSNTGNRRYGGIRPSFLPTLRKRVFAPPPTTHEAAVSLGVMAFRILGGPHFDEDEVRQLVEAQLARSRDDVGRIRQLLAIQASPERTEGLGTIRVPTLVMHGLMDQLIQPSGGIATARAIPESRLLMFPDMAHDLPGPRRGELAEEIVRNARRARG